MKIKFVNEGKEFEVDGSSNILNLAAQQGIQLNASCGGMGKCGRCAVIVNGKRVLACQTYPRDEMVIETISTSKEIKGKILSDSFVDMSNLSLAPITKKIFIELPQPSLKDDVSDLTRLARGLKSAGFECHIPLERLRKLPQIARSSDWKLSVTLNCVGHLNVLDIEPGKVDANYGLAVDIGTTTLVVSLLDLNSGKVVCSESAYNAQISLGEDVLARINYAMKNGTDELNQKVVGTINSLVDKIIVLKGISKEHISCGVISGNSTMIHLFLNIDPKTIRVEPYVPVATHPPFVRAKYLRLNINDYAPIYCVPSVSSYVGGDIVADVLACSIIESSVKTLMIDLGTNGEMVFGNNDFLVSCSCSAGPAFEGVGIEKGMRASDGAIESVHEDFSFDVIGDCEPKGICGSGLIDIVAELFKKGLIDRAGKFIVENEKVRAVNDEKRFFITSEVFIKESEIKDIIRAKAAVFAGCVRLLDSVNMNLSDVEKIVVCGGFGNYLNVYNAIAIGLLLDVDIGKYTFFGNGALKGAQMMVLSNDLRKKAITISDKMTYIELSRDSKFVDEFMSACFIPKTVGANEYRELVIGGCNSTGIGSLPLIDPIEAVSLVIESLDIPFWPQLPKRNDNESMYLQYSESLPGLKREESRFFIDTSSPNFGSSLESFFNNYVKGNLEHFKISEEYSKGLPAFILRNSQPFVKGQVTGPISFGLTVTDQNKRPLIYDEVYADVLVKNAIMKAKYQNSILKKSSNKVIIFVDEPSLCYFGSETVSLSSEQVKNYLGELFDAIHNSGAMVGLHCCSNTDWGLLMSLDLDVLSFDAYSFGDRFLIYHDQIKDYLNKGKFLALGIIPTGNDLSETDSNKVIGKFDWLVNELSSRTGIEIKTILKQTLITPSCGTGSLDPALAKKVFYLTKEVSDTLKRRRGE